MARSAEVMREVGKLGGRPKGSMSRAKLMMRELASMIVTDPEVQQKMLAMAKAGTLHPAVMRELFHYHGGRPPVKVEVTRPANLDARKVLVEAIRSLPRADRLAFADVSRKMLAAARVIESQAVEVAEAAGEK